MEEKYIVLNCERCNNPVVKLSKSLLDMIKLKLHYPKQYGPHFYHPECKGGLEVTEEQK